MAKILLTGVTGLVGAAFTVSILRQHSDIRITAIGRGRGKQSAVDRILETVKKQCEFDSVDKETESEILSRLTALEGDLFSLPSADELKKYGPFDSFFHCAADVNLGKDPEGKTRKINYEGTANVVALAKALDIKEFHYVSTAYVAGTLEGRVMEDSLPAKDFNNSYERSKFDAEKMVREAGFKFSIYRPSIVVGRLSDGKIRKPLAFYRILEFLAKLKKHTCSKMKVKATERISIPMRLEAYPSDTVFFVPLDYVQRTIAALYPLPVCNRTYHITGASPVRTKDIEATVHSVLKIDGITVQEKVDDPTEGELLMKRVIGDLMPYFSSQIIFDTTNVENALGKENLNWTTGPVFLEKMMSEFYRSNFPDVIEN